MRFGVIYLFIFLIGLTSFGFMVSNAPVHEDMLIGSWKENQWHYEKKAVNETSEIPKIGKADTVGGEEYRIHRAETWTFMEGGNLKLHCGNECVSATWSIKGRGHILQIKYSDNYTESYHLTELGGGKMVLNYECNAQAKGIAKLIFQKTEE